MKTLLLVLCLSGLAHAEPKPWMFPQDQWINPVHRQPIQPSRPLPEQRFQYQGGERIFRALPNPGNNPYMQPGQYSNPWVEDDD